MTGITLPKTSTPFHSRVFNTSEIKLKWSLIALGLMFSLALLVRIQFSSETYRHLPVREYRAALIARSFYLDATPSAPEWQRQVASINKAREGALEPPVMEVVVSWAYRVLGGEHLWIAPVLASIFWLIGGVFLFLIALRITSLEAAFFSLVFYLFVPRGISMSVSFQPDTLMIMFCVISLYFIIRFFEQPSTGSLILVTLLSASTFLIRPLVVFVILGAFIAISIKKRGIWKGLIDKNVLIFGVFSLLPTVLYYGYGLYIAKFLSPLAQMSFRPHLILHPGYWRDWLMAIHSEIGLVALFGALLGLPFLRTGIPRALVLGMWTGYFVFGLVFNYHIITHWYYHLQFVPIVALSLGPTGAFLLNRFRERRKDPLSVLAVTGLLLLPSVYTLDATHKQLNSKSIEDEAVAREIGQIVNHSTRVVFIAPEYGAALKYYGELSGLYWLRSRTQRLYQEAQERSLSIEERFEKLGIEPDYFVVTDFKEYENHHADLHQFLNQRATVIAQNERFLVYKLPEDLVATRVNGPFERRDDQVH